ncbi:MAG TPA: SpoIIE family protein phosphatase [Acidimicrobiales bacterium]|nr:SpoIIE family protein phosphatase [Acidimicrobiales bacterium]
MTEVAVYEAILASLPEMSVFAFDPDLRLRLVAGAAITRLGWRLEELLGRCPSELLEPDPGTALEDDMRAALVGDTRAFELPGVRWVDAYWRNTVSPLMTPTGAIVGGIIVSQDVGAARRAEQDRRRLEQSAKTAEEAARVERWQRERIEFLASINEILVGCETRQAVMSAIARAAVPRLGDWCSVSVFLDPRDSEPTVEVAHVEPAMVSYAKALQSRFPYDRDSPHGVPAVMRTGQAEFYPDIDDELLEALGLLPDAVGVVRRLSLRSSILVPLEVGGERLGALGFVITGEGRRFEPEDLTLAKAVAGRVSVALENRGLLETERDIASTLQASLLPKTLPDVPGVDLAVRHWPYLQGTQVGGDFYDVFPLQEAPGHAIVIGDVCGTGPASAAVTAVARHTIRGAAWHGDDHCEVLNRCNQALLASCSDIFCTVTYATIMPSPTGQRLTVASGGHPLPLLVREQQAPTTIGHAGTLLGVFNHTEHSSTTAELRPGDTVIFYTDGAYDLPAPQGLHVDELVELLTEAATSRSASTAEATAEGIAARLNAHAPFRLRADDTAVVVARIR